LSCPGGHTETENLAAKAKEVMGMNADEAKQEMQHAAHEGSKMASDMQAKAKGTVSSQCKHSWRFKEIHLPPPLFFSTKQMISLMSLTMILV
jgi:hypothetical protein